MYTSFYQLDSKPFENIPDPSFLWLGGKYEEALSILRTGIQKDNGFLLLTGDDGTGKTTLVNGLTEALEADVNWTVISDPSLEKIDFYNAISKGFGIEKQFTSKVQFLIQFSHFLHKADDENKKVLLLVDDCHLLSQEMLEELRLLSNIEKAEKKLINIYYIGRTEFTDVLDLPKNRALRQRISLTPELAPLSFNETDEYIRHRLKVAGGGGTLFSAKAVQVIHDYSEGVPERINIICDRALTDGSVLGENTIDHLMVEESVQKLNLPLHPSHADFENLSANQEEIDSFEEEFIPNTMQVQGTVSGFNIEDDDNRFRWLKYGLGITVVLAAGIYFWFSSLQPLEMNQVDTVVAEQTPVVKEPPQINSSPAVAMLEETRSGMDEEKAAELKTAILESAYKNSAGPEDAGIKEKREEERPGSTREVAQAVPEQIINVASQAEVQEEESQTTEVDALTAVTATEPVISLQEQPEDQQVRTKVEIEPIVVLGTDESGEGAAALKRAPAEEKSADVDVLAQDAAGEVTRIVVDAARQKIQIPHIEPLEPRKLRLGLQANSLQLTILAKKEFEKFTRTLKKYPKATVLVKGYVSSQNNSPENIKLSEERAKNVQNLLIAEGVDVEQVKVAGMGNQEPIATNATRAGRTKNRRVEIHVISDGVE